MQDLYMIAYPYTGIGVDLTGIIKDRNGMDLNRSKRY